MLISKFQHQPARQQAVSVVVVSAKDRQPLGLKCSQTGFRSTIHTCIILITMNQHCHVNASSSLFRDLLWCMDRYPCLHKRSHVYTSTQRQKGQRAGTTDLCSDIMRNCRDCYPFEANDKNNALVESEVLGSLITE